MTTTANNPAILLIPGHWLGAWAWDDVVEHLETEYSRVIPVTLPGLEADDPARAAKTVEDQAAAILETVNRHAPGQPVVIAAHSGANFPVSLFLDRNPERVKRVVWVDSGPVAPGSVFAPGLPDDLKELPLPPFEVLAGQASLEGLSADALGRFRAGAVPEPGPVLRQRVELTNNARRSIPTTLVCCSIPGAQVLELARTGHPVFAETANLEDMEVIDLPTGHWPMWSRPRDLAEAIGSAASRAG